MSFVRLEKQHDSDAFFLLKMATILVISLKLKAYAVIVLLAMPLALLCIMSMQTSPTCTIIQRSVMAFMQVLAPERILCLSKERC